MKALALDGRRRQRTDRLTHAPFAVIEPFADELFDRRPAVLAQDIVHPLLAGAR